jgi:hypothetical protein
MHASRRGWGLLANGTLLATAYAAGFEVMVTTDRSIEDQHGAYPVPVVIVYSLFNEVDDLKAYVPAILTLLNQPLQKRVYIIPRLP